jgi:glycosyltransferase involved in cell wall biosynthesis
MSFQGKWEAFISGIYSPSAKRSFMRTIERERPDIIHVHDLYPLLVWILPACREAGVPVVMTVHNYRLTCPTLFHFHKGKVCEKCCGGREYWCILRNCRGDLFESTAFALHNVVARRRRLFVENITIFIAITEFARTRLEKAGLPPDRIEILPNMTNLPDSPVDTSGGTHASYVGRFSSEKGLEVLLAAARISPSVAVSLAGDYSGMPELPHCLPPNARLVGHLNETQLHRFYHDSRFMVVPSKWFEVCPLTVLEAMGHGLPVIASRIGSLEGMVEEGVTGLLFEPNNSRELAGKMCLLWEDDELRRKLGQASREKAMSTYSADAYYMKLMNIYKRAVQMRRC